MASASLIVSCCLGNRSLIINSDNIPSQLDLEQHVISVVSLIFAATSLLGITILICQCGRRRTNTLIQPSHGIYGPGLQHVINCSLFSGMMADISIIVRSAVWLYGFYPQPMDLVFTDFRHVFCLVSSVLIVYFFLSVIFWHLVYGLEMLMVSQRKTSGTLVQYFLGWLLPAIICGLGTWVAFRPKPACGDRAQVDIGLLYAIVLLPVLIIFIILPCLFCKASTAVRRSIIQKCGQFATHERDMIDNLHMKFILIMVTFFACWLPNLLNGLFINTLEDRSGQVVLVFYILESVLNPFQVIIDALIFNGFPALFWCCVPDHYRHGYHRQGINHRRKQHSETDPLLSFSNQEL